MCEWFSCICFFQSGTCSHWHVNASWKPYVWEVCSVCLSYPSNPRSLHATHTFLWLMCSLLCILSTVLIMILCVCISCSTVIIRRSGKMEEREETSLCSSHVIHASIWLACCWQSSCVLTNVSVWDLMFYVRQSKMHSEFSQGKACVLMSASTDVSGLRTSPDFVRLSCSEMLMCSFQSYWSYYVIFYSLSAYSSQIIINTRGKVSCVVEI